MPVHRISRLHVINSVLGLVLLFQVLVFAALPISPNQNDSAWYYMNVHFSETGEYITESMYPSFNEPSQLYPFFGYSAFIFLVKKTADVTGVSFPFLLKWIQFLLYCAGALLLYLILKRFKISEFSAKLAVLAYSLYYAHFNFANLVMSETYAIFLLLLCTYFFICYRQDGTKLGWLLLISGHAVLVKPVFGLMFIAWLLFFLSEKKFRNLPWRDLRYAPLILAFPLLQIAFSHTHYGNNSIRKGLGWNLWNRVIYYGQLIPEDSESLKSLQTKLEENGKSLRTDLPWWYVTRSLSELGYNEEETQKICLNIALDGIKTHPFEFTTQCFSNSYVHMGLGISSRSSFSSLREYEKWFEKFTRERQHKPLMKQLNTQLTGTYAVNPYQKFMRKINSVWMNVYDSALPFIHSHMMRIFLLILALVAFYRKNPSSVIWLSSMVIVFASNLTEYPQSRLLLPAVVMVLLSVTIQLKTKAVK